MESSSSSESNPLPKQHLPGHAVIEMLKIFSSTKCTWQEAEKLGDKATKAPVLYSNIAYPQLRDTYPEFEDRLPIILQLWRKLRIEEKIYYAESARANRGYFDSEVIKIQGDVDSDLAEIDEMLSNLNVS